VVLALLAAHHIFHISRIKVNRLPIQNPIEVCSDVVLTEYVATTPFGVYYVYCVKTKKKITAAAAATAETATAAATTTTSRTPPPVV
jgi:hypothetical protein